MPLQYTIIFETNGLDPKICPTPTEINALCIKSRGMPLLFLGVGGWSLAQRERQPTFH